MLPLSLLLPVLLLFAAVRDGVVAAAVAVATVVVVCVADAVVCVLWCVLLLSLL